MSPQEAVEPWLKALVPSGIILSRHREGYNVTVRSHATGSWPPNIHQDFLLWPDRLRHSPDEAVIVYCRQLVVEYHDWIDRRRERAEVMRAAEARLVEFRAAQEAERIAEEAVREEREKRQEAERQARAARIRKAVEMRKDGATLRAIGAEIGVGPQRVKQILLKEERRITRHEKAVGEAFGHPWQMRFDAMPVSLRTRNCVLNTLGPNATLRDVAARSEAEWLRVPNFGRTSLVELKDALAPYGLLLGRISKIRDLWLRIGEVLDSLDLRMNEFEEELEKLEASGASRALLMDELEP